MLVRRYQGRNEEEAIAKAKAELGPDAIILHIKQLSKNGIFDLKNAAKVEMIVALDRDLNEFTSSSEAKSVRGTHSSPSEERARLALEPFVPTKSGGKPREGTPLAYDKEPQNSYPTPADEFRAYAISVYSNVKETSPTSSRFHRDRSRCSTEPKASRDLSFVGDVPISGCSESEARECSERENKDLRSESECQETREKNFPPFLLRRLGTAAQELYQHLLSHEVQEEVAQKLSLNIQELIIGDSSLSLREAMNICIEELIRTSGGLNIAQNSPHPKGMQAKPAVVAFIGPTGVGKTTTIAKLAAHYHLRENQKISLITVDTYRIAAVEQLKTYAAYIGIPLEVALTPQEMYQLVRKHKNCDLILIDTPGRSQKDSFKIQELKMLLSAASPQEVHLLLNVTTQHRTLWDVVRGFKILSPNRLLFTKLDESTCFGHILNFSVALGTPVSYLTTGQDVPDDIQLATIERITEYLLREGGTNVYLS